MTIVLVLTLVAHGCLIAAIEAAFGLQKRTVHGWIEAAGLTSHRWSMSEVLEYHVPPVCWQSQKRRGRRSKAMQHLLDPVGAMTTVGSWLRLGGWGEAVE